MTSSVVNLRQARKRKARDEKAASADANRIAHGRTKAERDTAAAERTLRARTLDGARRDD